MKVEMPLIEEEEKTPLVKQLMMIIEQQGEELRQLKDEIARMKKQNTRPKIPPSRLEKDPKDENPESKKKRPGSEKRSKNANLEIHETKKIAPAVIPEGSQLKGYQEFVVQDLVIKPHNTRYLLERWLTPEGEYLAGELPTELQGKHFAPMLQSYILDQYYQCLVTQPLLLEQLHDWGIDISAGQLNRILIEGKDRFHHEKDEILAAGLKASAYINVDDTGARHAGKNGYCTHIGNEFFAWFSSTNSKSRVNFLTLLRTGPADYVIDEEALEYLENRSFPKFQVAVLRDHVDRIFLDEEEWRAHLAKLGIHSQRHVQLATEGALFGSLLHHGLPRSLVIVSDDAGQFNILNHALCWIHAERTLNKLIPFDDKEKQAIEDVRDQVWDFYRDLKGYKQTPTNPARGALSVRFDEIFKQETCSEQLNDALKRLHRNKDELLLVLERPEIPLHNNLSEGDIREYVKRRKISGGTRSATGRRCRDTFTSLKKTCRKLGVSFWEYLVDRIRGANRIPPLSDLIRQKAGAAG